MSGKLRRAMREIYSLELSQPRATNKGISINSTSDQGHGPRNEL